MSKQNDQTAALALSQALVFGMSALVALFSSSMCHRFNFPAPEVPGITFNVLRPSMGK